MQPEFGLAQEQRNKLYCMECFNSSSRMHFHSQLEIYFVDDGEMEVWVNNNRSILKAGEMSVALSYDAHCYQTVSHSRSNFVIIPTYMCEEFISSFKGKRITNPFIRDKEAVKRIRECYDALKKDTSNRIKTLGLIYLMLGLITESINYESTTEPIDASLSSKLLFYINDNFKNDISLSSIASEFGYNSSYISRYFRSCFGIGINKYITTIRLKHAILLMNEKSNSITYCALESGFNSMRTFYRAFFEEFGCSPKEYINIS